jgi:isopenicillin N synthase-like dioxygenase
MPDISKLQAHDENMSTARLPLVDMSPYLDPESSAEARRETAAKLDKACREFGEWVEAVLFGVCGLTSGFFYVTGHGLDTAYLKSLLKLGHDFFELPEERKDAIHIFKSQDGVRGYQKIGENVTYAKRDQQEVSRAITIALTSGS